MAALAGREGPPESGRYRMSAACLLMDVSSGGLHVFDRGHRQDPVSEIENVAWTSGDTVQHVVDRFKQAIQRCEEDGGSRLP